jgi:4-methylaminobutanoate oxidase (formaldehyde-forming)
LDRELPKHARAVVIGGGVIGCSVAYHLAKLGWRDVVLLERKQLTCGTTWHAAGLIGQLRATLNMTKLAQYSAELYSDLEAETEVATGFKQNGSLAIALTDDRWEELRRDASRAKLSNLELDVLSARECRDAYPLLDLTDVRGGLFLPKDGQADPANIALGLAKGARANGVSIFEGVKVTDIGVEQGRVAGVETEHGAIDADCVVNCAGMWARDVSLMAGAITPLHACEHFYVVTEAIPDLPRDLPVLRAPDERAYYKEDAGKLLIGCFEEIAKPWGMDGIAEDFCFDQLPEDFDHFAPILELACDRVPVLAETGIHTFFNGPEAFTPDDRYLLGETPEVENLYVAAGFNSVGIQSAGGAGKALAEWMDGGEPPFDLSDVDVRRMAPFQNNVTYLKERVTETLGLLYGDHYPTRQYETSRDVFRSPFYARHADLGARFGEVAGWERPNFFCAPGAPLDHSHGWRRQPWFEQVAFEHRAVRENVGVFDMSSFAKFRVNGADALDVLQLVSANNIDTAIGAIVYTQWLNRHGGVEADLTVTRDSETSFIVVTSAAARYRDQHWLRRHIPENAECQVSDITEEEAVLAVMGPSSRTLMGKLSTADISNESFPFGTAKLIEIAGVVCRAHRVTYVGELGWEIYAPTKNALIVFDAIRDAGRSSDLSFCGMHAMETCRTEKASRHSGHDVTDEDHVVEAGLGFAVKMKAAPSRFGDFIGKPAVAEKRRSGLIKRMMQFRLEDPMPLLFHHEPIWRNGKLAGYVTSGAFGHTVGAAVGLGYVACERGETKADMLASAYEIEIAGERCLAEPSFEPLYDPSSIRPRV